MILKDLRMLKTSFAMNMAYAGPDEVEIETDTALEAFDNGDKKEFVAMMTIKTVGEKLPYSFTLQYGVKFQLSDDEDESQMNRICTVNIPGIIYPYLREFIADLTRRAGFPPLLMQPVNFVKAAKLAVIEKK